MTPAAKQAFDHELHRARCLYRLGAWPAAFGHLERAHILGQRFLGPHLRVHAWMLRLALRRRDVSEMLGQVCRLVAVFVGFALGWVPLGNTGGSDVSALRSMPLPEDLAELLEDADAGRARRGVFVAFLITCVLAGLVLLWP